MMTPERLAEIGRFFGASWTAEDYTDEGQRIVLDQAHQMGREALAEVERLRAQVAEADGQAWTAYVRGFGEYIGETLYETARLAREDSGLGERIYRLTHIETVTPGDEEQS